MGARWTDTTFSRRDDARPPVRVDAGTTTSRGSHGSATAAGGHHRRPWSRRRVGAGGAASAGRASRPSHRCAPYERAADIEPAESSIDMALALTAACLALLVIFVAANL